MQITRKKLSEIILKLVVEHRQDDETKVKPLLPARVHWEEMGWNTWLVSAYAWKKEMEPGDWFDEPDEETLRAIQILSQKVKASPHRARNIIADKLDNLGYVEDEAGFLDVQKRWLESRGHI